VAALAPGATGMIATDFAALTARLQARARALAQARLAAARAQPAQRWRRAGWLWPLFGKGASPWK
jgi:hypothetical protein